MKLDELVRRVDADWYHEDEESSARDGFSGESALPPLEPLENDGFSNEWPDRIVYSADGMTAHSYYFEAAITVLSLYALQGVKYNTDVYKRQQIHHEDSAAQLQQALPGSHNHR